MISPSFRFFTGLLILQLLINSARCSSDADDDEVLTIPGWTGALPSKQFSGYLNGASSNHHLHYWLVESERDPVKDPVVFWFNGGPGCSSLDGFFYEMGPFVVSPTNYSQLTLREHRWNRIANMVYLESPVGVGFSYSDDGVYTITDDTAATDNRAAVEAFYVKFPNFKENELFITGESYAGIYVPTLAEAIVQGQLDGTYTGARLTGIAVGNGCIGNEVGICGSGSQAAASQWSYLLQTPLITHDLKLQIADTDTCNWAKARENQPNALSESCIALLDEASLEIDNVCMYNIFGDCVSNSGCDSSDAPNAMYHPRVPSRGLTFMRDDHLGEEQRYTPYGPKQCIDSRAASGYVNDQAVMTAIHVRDPGFCWSVCRSAPGWSYTSTRPNLPRDTYPFLLQHINVYIYNGDWDACVPYTDNEAWTEGMGFKPLHPWHKWSFTSDSGAENQVAGYAVTYDISELSKHTFAFLTIKGGGHMAPDTAPAQSLEMFKRIISNIPF